MGQYSRQLQKGIRWFYKFDLNGKTYRSNTIYHTKTEAKKAEAEAYTEADYRQRNPKESPEISLLQAINERLDYILVRKSKSYYNDNKRYLGIALFRFGDFSIDSIKRGDIETLLQAEIKRGVYTVNAILRSLKALFNHAIDSYDLDIKNPCSKIRLYAVEKRIKYIPTDIEINTLLTDCSEPQRRLIEFIRDTGARLSEALNLTGKDVTNVDVTLYTRKSTNSNLVARIVDKPDCLNGLTFAPETKVFGNWNAQPKFLERKLKKLGLKPWGYHNLRHRFASKLSAENTPIFEIMKLLGHSSISTTQIYLQTLPKFRDDLGTMVKENSRNLRLYRM